MTVFAIVVTALSVNPTSNGLDSTFTLTVEDVYRSQSACKRTLDQINKQELADDIVDISCQKIKVHQ